MTTRELLDVQIVFNRLVQDVKYGRALEDLTLSERNQAFKDTVLAVHSETSEFLDRVNWKMHKQDQPAFDTERALEEVVDMVKYVFNFLVYMGVSAEDFDRKFQEKTQTVLSRFLTEFPEAKVRLPMLGHIEVLRHGA